MLRDNRRTCATCHLLKDTAFQRPLLMRLRVKDLRQYLVLRNVPTDTCREKDDLVDLVLCHQGAGRGDDEGEEEEDVDRASLGSRVPYTPPPSAAHSASELTALAASQGEALSPSDGSGTNQVRALTTRVVCVCVCSSSRAWNGFYMNLI